MKAGSALTFVWVEISDESMLIGVEIVVKAGTALTGNIRAMGIDHHCGVLVKRRPRLSSHLEI